MIAQVFVIARDHLFVFVVSVRRCLGGPRLRTYTRRRGKIPRVSWPPLEISGRRRFYAGGGKVVSAFVPIVSAMRRPSPAPLQYPNQRLLPDVRFFLTAASLACFIRVMALRHPYLRQRSAVYVWSLDEFLIHTQDSLDNLIGQNVLT